MNNRPEEPSEPSRDVDPSGYPGDPAASAHPGDPETSAYPSAASVPPASGPPELDPGEAMSLGRKVGLTVVIVLAVLFGVFAVGNSHRVTFSWVFGVTEARVDAAGNPVGGVPLILLLIAALVIGLVVGALLEWQFLRSRRHKAAKKREENRDHT